MTWEAELERCPLAAGPFPPDARRCDWCGEALTGRRRRWCSDACSNAYSVNHAWTSARAAALRRDEVCQRCGSTGIAPAECWYAFIVFVCGRFPPRFRTDEWHTWARENGWMACESNEPARRCRFVSASLDAYRAFLRRRAHPYEAAGSSRRPAERATVSGVVLARGL